jgi:hypothetical protein
MNKKRMVKRITKWRPDAVRRIGRPRMRWEVEVRENLGKIKILNWGKISMEREVWKRTVEQARTQRVVAPREEEESLKAV